MNICNLIEINRSFVSTGCPDKFATLRHRCRKEGVTVGNLALAATWMAMAQVKYDPLKICTMREMKISRFTDSTEISYKKNMHNFSYFLKFLSL